MQEGFKSLIEKLQILVRYGTVTHDELGMCKDLVGSGWGSCKHMVCHLTGEPWARVGMKFSHEIRIWAFMRVEPQIKSGLMEHEHQAMSKRPPTGVSAGGGLRCERVVFFSFFL